LHVSHFLIASFVDHHIDVTPLFSLQVSGLPLKLSAKFQINLVMSDVKSMAHCAQFSHMTIPMLWFEIGLLELPEQLQSRFKLYLNTLPLVEKAGLYGCFVLGLMLSIFAVTKMALRTSKSLASQKVHQKYNRNLINNSVYNACEEKLMGGGGGGGDDQQHQTKSVLQIAANNNQLDSNKSDDGSDDDEDLIIKRDQYELEDLDAISDIDYTETSLHDKEEDSSSSSSLSEQVWKFVLFRRAV